ncbi:polysaccharide deacetylase family protein [Halomarina ordinaria]|uniref:Polysaccharide deacetylase family protein n=1 Tax=Halomarina ordinaria TaxID=3033939 RepID=A0ABD5UB21_9EURY|nr:polysaccharide deacetylase family protein [Halomarina sp. PSRA2]
MERDRRLTTRRAFLATGSLALGTGCVGSLRTRSPDDESTNRTVPRRDGPSDRSDDDARGDEEPDAHREGPDGVRPPYQGRYVARGRLVDDMSDLSAWSGRGTVEADESVYFDGPQSLRYTDTERVALERTFDEPLDLSDAALSLAGYFEEPADGQPTLTVTAFAPDSSNCVRFRHPYIANKDAGWQRFDLAPCEVKGSPDLADVRTLHVMLYAGKGKEARLWLDDVRLHPKPDRGKLLFRFDDSHRHHYTDYFTTLEEYGYPGIEAVVRNSIGRGDRLTVPMLHRMQDAGWDLCNHMTAHQNVTELSEETLRADVREMAAFFEENGITRGTNFHIYTFGAYDGPSMDVLADYFDLAFGGGGPTNYALTNPMCVGSVGVDGDLEGAKELVDLAVEHRSLSIPLFHHFDAEDFAELVEYVHAYEARGDLDVVSASDLWEHQRSGEHW